MDDTATPELVALVRDSVALWRLTPRDAPQNLDAWTHSVYWGPAIIRAPDETAAREIAQRAFLELADAKAPLQEIRF